jgi:hypothetical protein
MKQFLVYFFQSIKIQIKPKFVPLVLTRDQELDIIREDLLDWAQKL